MLQTLGKTCGRAMALLCLVSMLAMAQTPAPGQTLGYTKIDAMGHCISTICVS